MTLKFLEILSEQWPKILAERGVIDASDRRNRLILALADFWRNNPPDHPIIVVGTTGSIPATAELISSVAAMPKGMIVLPGFDVNMDQKSWEALDETHPQYGMKQLLQHLRCARERVQAWRDDIFSMDERRVLAGELMRPAETSGQWTKLVESAQSVSKIETACKDIALCVCEHEREEAKLISVLLREALVEPDKTACLITPDRMLAARVTAMCLRWRITVDDSAGSHLRNSVLGHFIMLVLSLCNNDVQPKDLLALLQHPLCAMEMEQHLLASKVSALDMALRGEALSGFVAMRLHMERYDQIPDDQRALALALLQDVEGYVAHFHAAFSSIGYEYDFVRFLRAHLELCEKISSTPDMDGRQRLWSGADGQAASVFFSSLLAECHEAGTMKLDAYAESLALLMRGVTLRPRYGVHPRVQILGQIEARMIDADLVIMSGLNEGVWPADSGADPWMSRPMRSEFGLPGLERSIGLAAHDFVQGFCAPHVVLTRAKKQGGAPSVPSRWLQRLDAVLQAVSFDPGILEDRSVMALVRAFDGTDDFKPALRPAPKPSTSARPRRLSVTRIETWLRDPYSIYASHILRVRPLEPLSAPVDAALRGNILHDVMDGYIKAYPDALPANGIDIVRGLAQSVLEAYVQDEASLQFWQPRLDKILFWHDAHERQWRNGARPVISEGKGKMHLQTKGSAFVLSARVDRIDQYRDGHGAAIIDYKSGGTFSISSLKRGDYPQLPLQALILRAGGFENAAAMQVSYLGYWVMSGAAEAGKVSAIDEGIDDLCVDVEENLLRLIDAFDNADMPYLSLPRASYLPRFNDYEHLARVAEWSTLDDAESEAA